MKTSSVSFADLRRLLLSLGFTESRTKDFWHFEHSASGAGFLFRPYSAEDHVSMPNLASTRMHLDWRGLLSKDAFDDLLTKTPA
jgi:hypothetical protein